MIITNIQNIILQVKPFGHLLSERVVSLSERHSPPLTEVKSRRVCFGNNIPATPKTTKTSATDSSIFLFD